MEVSQQFYAAQNFQREVAEVRKVRQTNFLNRLNAGISNRTLLLSLLYSAQKCIVLAAGCLVVSL
jgi:hypothetical protein